MKVTRTSEAIPLSDAPEPRQRVDATPPAPSPAAKPRVWGFDPSSLDDDQDFGPLAGGGIVRADLDDADDADDDEAAPLGTWARLDDSGPDLGHHGEPLAHGARGEAPKPGGIDRSMFPDLPTEGVKLDARVSRGGFGLRDRLGVDAPTKAEALMLARRAGGDMRAALGVDGE